METILNITNLYFLVLLLSLLIERAMEVVMATWNWFELKYDGHRFWNRRAVRLQNEFASRVSHQLDKTSIKRLALYHRIHHYTDTPQVIRPGKTVVFSSRAVRHVFVRTFAFIVTSILGVVLCSLAGINLIAIVKATLHPHNIPLLDLLGPGVQLVVSGLVVGMGSEPVHRFIKGIESSKAWVDQRSRINRSIEGQVTESGVIEGRIEVK